MIPEIIFILFAVIIIIYKLIMISFPKKTTLKYIRYEAYEPV